MIATKKETETPRGRRIEFKTVDSLMAARESGDATKIQRAEQAVVVECLPIAAAVARRYRRRTIDAEDVEQVARIGLVKAVHRWEPTKGALLGYLMPTIHGEVKRYFRDSGSSIRIPRSLYEARPRVAEAERVLSQQLGRSPNTAEIADAAGLETDQVKRIKTATTSVRSLSDETGDDWLLDAVGETDEDRLPVADWRTVLRPAIASLPARERKIIALRFIWGQNQQQIAASLGVSQMHVSRLLRATLDRLRRSLNDVGLDAPQDLSDDAKTGI